MSLITRINFDAFSAGQIESKLWAARELEKIVDQKKLSSLRMVMLGGWYSLLHFILKTRENVKIEYCRSLDLDPLACHVANHVNNTWEMKEWEFRSYPIDCNNFVYEDDKINCVINTSTEHFMSNRWFDNIPKNTLLLLQGNNLAHDDEETRLFTSLDEFKNFYPITEVLYSGEMRFDFKSNPYTRYMVIGYK